MRLNPKVYQLAEGYEPIETQEFDGRLVQIYYLDDFDSVYNQNVPKGKFAVWTSVDGTNYRLFIEKGFYSEVKELYSQPINKIWLDFWDQCDDVTKKFNFRILMPLALVCLAIYIILTIIPGIESWAMYVQIGIFVVFIVGLLLLNKVTKNKINECNKASVNLIKEELTPDGFDNVLEKQKNYIDSFFAEKQREIDEEMAREEAAKKEENIEENKEVYVDDVTDLQTEQTNLVENVDDVKEESQDKVDEENKGE